jgi:hypothetical protein
VSCHTRALGGRISVVTSAKVWASGSTRVVFFGYGMVESEHGSGPRGKYANGVRLFGKVLDIEELVTAV